MAQIIEFWRAVELFDPPAIPKPTKESERKTGTECVQTVELRGKGSLPLLPWQDGHALREEIPGGGRRHGASWRHTVYGGVFAHSLIRDTLADHFGLPREENLGGAHKSGHTAVFALTVDEDGVFLEETVAFSACAWATGRIIRPGPEKPDWLDGFDDVEETCEHAVGRLTREKIFYSPDTTNASTAGWQKLIREILGSAAESAVTALIGTLTGTIGAVGVGVATGVAKPIMTRVAKRLTGKDKTGNAEKEKPPEERPEESPPGRMVTAPDLVGIAAHVADLCGVANLVDPMQLRIESKPVFRKKDGSLPEPERPFLNSLLPEDLARVTDAAKDGYGTALTEYLTDPDRIRTDRRINVRNAPEVVLNGVHPNAFPLGRWPSDSTKPLALSQQFAVNHIVAELLDGGGLFSVNGPPGTGKSTLLRDLIAAIVVTRAERLAELPHPRHAFTQKTTWQGADEKTHEVRMLRPELTGYEIVVASSNNAAVENITSELPALSAIGEEWHDTASYFLEQTAAFLDGPAWGAIAAPLGNSEKRRQFRERFWFGPKNTGMHDLLHRLDTDHPVLHDPSAKLRFPDSRTSPAPVPPGTTPTPTNWRAATDRFRIALREVRKHRDLRSRDARVKHFPRNQMDQEDEERELSAPWADPEWNRARSELFLAALDLHRAFVTGVAWIFRRNVGHLIAAMRRSPDAPPPEAELAAWQTLFLLIPVVSTTFTSCGRLFQALGPESLGWLLIDEAGQAGPQKPVGALWRTQRAVFVGDPLQLEPIDQVPESVQSILRGCYGVAPLWKPSEVSAQGVADRFNRWGTTVRRRLKDGEFANVWVGAPLRVHRRCERPMFDVSNSIAYDDLMVYGTEERSFLNEHKVYSASGWVHVEGGDAEGKWIPEEGRALTRMVTKLHRENDVSLDRIRILSPFTDVVRNCRRVVDRLRWDADPPPGVDEDKYREQVSYFIAKGIGTVHTMQGREADVVLLVLGTLPQRDGGARKWASETANLLNVAVSRAKRRFFVIGNHKLWSDLPHFSELADLPRYAWSEGEAASAAIP